MEGVRRGLPVFVLLGLVILLGASCGQPRSPGVRPTESPTVPAFEFPTIPASPSGGSQTGGLSGLSQPGGGPPGVDQLGSLTEVPPAPLPMPAGGSDQAAKTLAQQVTGEGGDVLPALLTALQASGIAVHGPVGELVFKPAEPAQGLAIESWEVPALLLMVQPEHTVSMSLPDFADVLTTALRGTQAAQLEQSLVDDVRALAQGPVSPDRFWARFIVELGRQQTDLLSEPDPANIQLNGLQVSLILRRLASDIAMRVGAPEGSAAPVKTSGGWFSPRIAYADALPCTMSDTEKKILDVAASEFKSEFGLKSILKTLEGSGAIGYQTADNIKGSLSIASALLTYAKLIAAYAVLDVKVDMTSPPLVRTHDARPKSGEPRDLTATVRFNTGNAQIVNCFRIMLNAAGVDFKVPQDGPVKGAHVEWEGVLGFSELTESRGGPEQIVRFVGQGSSAGKGSNPITDSVTDGEGKVRVGIEGVGQKTKKGANATKLMKHASLRVNVALKGADFFGDLKEAAGAAAGGVKALVSLPAEMLYRSKWASAGHYTFEVVDWAGAQWTGTVTLSETSSSRGENAGTVSEGTATREVKVQVIETTQYSDMGETSVAEMKGTIDVQQAEQGADVKNWGMSSCGQSFNMTDSAESQADGSATGEALITVTAQGLHYSIDAQASPSLDLVLNGQTVLKKQNLRRVGDGCQVAPETKTQTLPIEKHPGVMGIKVEGDADPNDLDRLSGSTTKTTQEGGLTTTTTITWDLERS